MSASVLLRFVLIAGLLATAAASAATSTATANPTPEARLADLARQVKRLGAPDSLKYAYAMALAGSGTIENRYQAFLQLKDIRATYEKQPRYHRDIAQIFIDARQPSRAVTALEEVVKLEPGDVDTRVLIARLLLDDLLYHYDLSNTAEMTRWLDSALAIDPDHRDALFLSSLALELGARLPEAPADMSDRGKAFVVRLLDRNPDDVAARLLLAVHEMDLGRPDEAQRAFRRALDAAPEDVRQAFYAMDYTANERALERAKRMDPETKEVFNAVYWIHQDPSPITTLNENQLEVWKRMALAEFLLGRPEKNLRGWEVPAGEAYVRFGPPKGHDFDPGEIRGQGGGKDYSGIRFVAPSWNWIYAFRDATFQFKFEDKSLNGNFIMDGPTVAKMDVLRKRAPVIYDDATPGRIRYLYLSSNGVAGTGRQVRQTVHLAVPLWRPAAELAGSEKVSLDIRVESATRGVTKRARRYAVPDDIVSPVRGLDILLVSNEFALAPGRYRATAYVSDGDRKIHGIHSLPFEVRDYAAAEGLVVSDLALSFRVSRASTGPVVRTLGETHLPNPLGMVGDERNLEIFYEMYGLTAKSGVATQEARYTILPRAYLLEYEKLVEQGLVTMDLPSFAARGGTVDGVTLDTDNSLDVTFPPGDIDVKSGRGSKATRLALGALVPGEYVFVATIRDRTTDQVGSARTFFRILTDTQFRGLFGE